MITNSSLVLDIEICFTSAMFWRVCSIMLVVVGITSTPAIGDISAVSSDISFSSSTSPPKAFHHRSEIHFPIQTKGIKECHDTGMCSMQDCDNPEQCNHSPIASGPILKFPTVLDAVPHERSNEDGSSPFILIDYPPPKPIHFF